jgi:hypothetical protein
MLSAQRFVDDWRQAHAFEVMTIEGLAQMLVAYAEQFLATERERVTAEVAATGRWCREDERATMRAQIDDLDWGHDQLERPTVLVADVKALLGGSE